VIVDRVVVFAFGPAWGMPLPSSGPFAIKLLTWLRMHDLPHELSVENDPRKGPKGKSPWARVGSRVVADSELVIEAVRAAYGIEEERLTPHERAITLTTRRTLEEHYHQVWEHQLFVHDDGWRRGREFFDYVPIPLRYVARRMARAALRKQLIARGLGRHSQADIVKSGIEDLTAIEAMLGDQPYFLGDEPRAIDATVFAFLGATYWTPGENAVWRHLRARPRLVAYCDRMRERFFSEPQR
jgi:glutathione S-transferase